MFKMPDKYPQEVVKGLWFDFKNKFLDTETIVSSSVELTSGTVVDKINSGTIVTWSVDGGISGERIVATVSVVGSLGSERVAKATYKIL